MDNAHRVDARIILLSVSLAALILSADLVIPLGVAGGVPYVAVVLLALWLPGRRYLLLYAAVGTALTISGFFFSPPGGELWKVIFNRCLVIFNRCLAIFAIWVTAVLCLQRKRADEALKAAHNRLQEAHRELGAFVHTVSHDLRAPLTPIIGFTELLQESHGHRLDETGLKTLDTIVQQGHRMQNMLDDLLALARMGRLDRPAAPVDADSVVEEVLIDLESRRAESGILIKKAPLPAPHVPKTLLSQIFANLIGNAIRYAGGEGGPIEVDGEKKGGRVRYHIRDHGTGILEEERGRIFDLFCRGCREDSSPGTGVGLATVEKIAHLYGGRAWVEETPGGGSTFWVELIDEPPTKERRGTK